MKTINVAAITLVACLSSACDNRTPEQKRQAAEQAVGTQASIAAIMVVNAYRACAQIGIQDVTQCSQYKGNLIAEQTAQIQAGLAVEQTRRFINDCQLSFSGEYCNALIQRATAIEINKPPTQ